MSLQIQNVSKIFKQFRAVNDVSFTVEPGEIVSILGPSGCGKSTLLQMVAGLQSLDEGEIRLDGKIISSPNMTLPPEKRGINMVFQDYALWPHMTVVQNIFYGSKIRKVNKQEQAETKNFLFNLLQLNGLENRYPSELSGGQQQRVAIARALSTKPTLLLLDEPLSNLDMQLRFEMRNELSYLLRKLGTTALHVTHDPLEAYALADRILMLREGQIEQYGTPMEVRQAPASLWVAGLLGMTNRLMATAKDSASVKIGDAIIRGNGTLTNGDDVIVVMDSEALKIGENGNEINSLKNSLHGRVTHSIFEGHKWRIMVETAGGRLTVLHGEQVEVNKEVVVSFERNHTFLYKQTEQVAPPFLVHNRM
ncbi:ABC transporter ATP-binding protein [Psychrobacillus sp. NPDC096426]|uniref:ABC transporter ATP-binding protein n=1 Tax=Psychrobacillus sp. NPDC096426 TaxID=3364491 RepID=UPI003802EB13